MLPRILVAIVLIVAPALAQAQSQGTPSFQSLTLTGSGSTGDVSGMSVTPSGSAASGTLARLLYSPAFPGKVTAGGFTAANNALTTTQTTPNGSVGEGPTFVNATRSGGYGQYGNALFSYYVTAPTPAGQFDVGLTSWATHQNISGGQVFGGWLGANTPSSGNNYSGSPLNETFSSGAAIGAEINVGNRWADWGLQYTPGAHYTTGLQIVPDVLPASDGPSSVIYPGTYGIAIGQSVHGHKWWVGQYLNYDSLMPGGIAYLTIGGSVAGNAPLAAHAFQGYWQTGLDFSGAAFSSSAINFAAGQSLSVAGSGTINLAGNLTMTGAAWTSYAPTLTAGSGTLTAAGSVSGAYQKIGKTVVGQITATITTNGTGAGSLSISLPPGLPATGNATVTFVEDLVTGQPAFGIIYSGATAVQAIRKADGTYPGGDGRRFIGSFTYQTP
jgi:hypothetical protein